MNKTLGHSRIIIFSFTRIGTELNRRLCAELQREKKAIVCYAFAPSKYSGDGVLPLPENIREHFRENWGKAVFIFVGATGIAVRYIAPWVKDKYTDSPVIVVDEKGQYVIPLLSGHIGGAAAMADEISQLMGAVSVHTTATDVQGKFAVDVFAKNNDLLITDREMIKKISAAVLEGEKVAFFVQNPQWKICGNMPDGIVLCGTVRESEQYSYTIAVAEENYVHDKKRTLVLKPRNIAVGIGCRKGISVQLLESGLLDILELNGLCIEQIKMIASIDLKKEEQALVQLSEKYHIPFETYTADELGKVQTVSAGSEFVKKVTGVDNVCERAAKLCCAEGKMIQEKAVRESMTCAFVMCPVEIKF